MLSLFQLFQGVPRTSLNALIRDVSRTCGDATTTTTVETTVMKIIKRIARKKDVKIVSQSLILVCFCNIL